MKILLLTLIQFDSLQGDSIYHDLVNELIKKGANVDVVSPIEARFKQKTEVINQGSNKVLKVKTGNITKTKSKLKKGIATILFEYKFLYAIKRYLRNEKYDLVIYSTPPITFNKIIYYLKKKYQPVTYLMLKDIFPQNAVDLRMMSTDSLVYKYFRHKEKKLYELSDFIGCMSDENVNYIIKNNQNITRDKVEVFPNSISIKKKELLQIDDKYIRTKYNLPLDKAIFLYGGNIGKPQGVEFILEVANNFNQVINGFLLIVGDGTEFDRLNNGLDKEKNKNVKLIKRLDKSEYEKIAKTSDIGLIFLDKRFTIPNFPSRLLSYMKFGMPIIAATDAVSDVGDILEKSGSGYKLISDDVNEFIKLANNIIENKSAIRTMGRNSYQYMKKNYNIEKNVNLILEKVKK